MFNNIFKIKRQTLLVSLFSLCLCEQNILEKRVALGRAHKILIVSFGKVGGHVSLDNSIIPYLKNNCDIDIFDVEDLIRFTESYHYKVLQNSITTASIIQRLFCIGYNIFIFLKLPPKVLNQFFKLDEFKQNLIKNKYDLVIFTSPCHINEINAECIKQKIPCVTITADYGDCDVMAKSTWIRNENMAYLVPQDSYFTPSKQHASVAQISGIPIRPGFKRIRNISKQEMKTRLGLDPTVPCVVVFYGAAGSEEMYKIAKECRADKAKKFIFLCGSHEKLKTKINAMNCSNFTVLGYVNNPVEYIRAADVLVSKPGGLSTTEAIQCETPCIFKYNGIFSILPAEVPNLKYSQAHGYCVVVLSYKELPAAVDKIMSCRIAFHQNNALDESVSIIRRMLKQKGKWIKRFYS